MHNKIAAPAEVVAIIRDGDTLANTGFVGNGAPEELLIARESRFLETKSPSNRTLFFAADKGDGGERGGNRLGHDDLLKRVTGEPWCLLSGSDDWRFATSWPVPAGSLTSARTPAKSSSPVR